MARINLTRESILGGEIHAFARQHRSDVYLMTDAEREASLDAVFADPRAHGDVWVFGYGSLIWNPAIHFAEQRTGRIYGYHRRFCMWTQLGRGCPENPGLMLALTRGGSCGGVGYRIHAGEARTELDVLWRREMMTAAYSPTWVRLHTDAGPADAITFTINPTGERYAGRLDLDTVAQYIARAAGPLGRCSDYLFETTRHLDELGIADRRLSGLAHAVAAIQRELQADEIQQQASTRV